MSWSWTEMRLRSVSESVWFSASDSISSFSYLHSLRSLTRWWIICVFLHQEASYDACGCLCGPFFWAVHSQNDPFLLLLMKSDSTACFCKHYGTLFTHPDTLLLWMSVNVFFSRLSVDFTVLRRFKEHLLTVIK